MMMSELHPNNTHAKGDGHGAEVDSDWQVHGLASFLVEDASIMPNVVDANTHASTIMFGGETAAVVLERNPSETIP